MEELTERPPPQGYNSFSKLVSRRKAKLYRLDQQGQILAGASSLEDTLMKSKVKKKLISVDRGHS